MHPNHRLTAPVFSFATLLLLAATTNAATITGLSRSAGFTGTWVVVLGTGLSATAQVHFTMKNFDGSPTSAFADFQILSDTQVRARIWPQSVTGPITLVMDDGSTASSPVFRVRRPHDIDGDGRADILWQDTHGGIGMWAIANGQVLYGALIGYIPSGVQYVGSGDFNGDGRADILWRDSAGGYGIWLLNGSSIIGSGPLPAVPAGFTFGGIGDLDDDGKDDIIWRDSASGVGAWLMNGLSIKAGGFIGNAPSSLVLAGVGDLNGDGKADIVWQDTDGTVGIWLLNVFTITSGAALGKPTTGLPVKYVADISGAGYADIIFADATTNREEWIIVNGQHVTGGPCIGCDHIEAVADYDGDGATDYLWYTPLGGGPIDLNEQPFGFQPLNPAYIGHLAPRPAGMQILP